MGKDLEILAGLMAVQLRLVPGPRFIQAGAQAEADPSVQLTRRLVADRVVGEAEMASILMLAVGQVRQHGGDETAALAAAPIDPKVIDALIDAGPSPKLKGLLRMLRPSEKLGTAVLPGHSPQMALIDTSDLDDVLSEGDIDLKKDLRAARPAAGSVVLIPASAPARPAETPEVQEAHRAQKLRVAGVSDVRRSGSLTVRTRAFACACVREGREFAQETLMLRGLNLLSGLSAGKQASRGPGGPPRPWRLKAHGPECVPAPLPGAQVWLFRYEVSAQASVLATPKDVTGRGIEPLPSHLRDALFAKQSPHAPVGPGVYLGTTPVEGVVLPAGSWMLLVWQSGRNPARVPVRTGVSGSCAIEVTLSLPTEVPPRFASIAEGTFVYQGDSKNPHSEPSQAGTTPEYLLAKYPVTAKEYAEFLNARQQTELDLVVRRSAPRELEKATSLWPGPPFFVPTAQALAAATPEIRAAARKLPGCIADWNERWPIVSISWVDAMLYCEWKRSVSGWLMTLPHEVEWEKAARGVDGRTFPWGHHLRRGACRTISENTQAASPAGVDEFPGDESPYGVIGLGGNARDICLNEPGPEFAGQRVMRGGYWASDGLRCHSSFRSCSRQDHISPNSGFRMMCLTRVPPAPPAPDAGATAGGGR
ncbi:MAG: serine/threonine protein kinase [Planctomycetota bacterium]|nr:MAG: serine/threonine protein kinase [Planctomycetota bacterium]